MAATKKTRVDRTFSTDNATDATARNLLSFTAGSGAFNSSTGVISIPTNTNQLTNGAGFITASDISGKQNTLVSGTNIKTVNNTTLLGSGNLSVQATLVSGTNIKTINGESILGSGDLTVSGGGGSYDQSLNTTDDVVFDSVTVSSSVTPISIGTPTGGEISWYPSGAQLSVYSGSTNFSTLSTYAQTLSSGSQVPFSFTYNGTFYKGLGNITSITVNNSVVAFGLDPATPFNWDAATGGQLGYWDNFFMIYVTNLTIGGGSVTSFSASSSGVTINGNLTVSSNKIALGSGAGTGQGDGAVAIGAAAGQSGQSANAVAIGDMAGTVSQGDYSIAVGYSAGYSNQADNSIVLNASGSALNASTTGLFIKPVRSATTAKVIYYNSTTGEMTYGDAPSGGGGGGGGGTSPADYFSFQNPNPGGQNSFTFTLPAASGPIFASIYMPPGSSISSISPSTWTVPTAAGQSFGGPSYYVSTSPSGTQTVALDSSSNSSVSLTLFVLDPADAGYQYYFNPGNNQASSGTITLSGPVQQNLLSWTSTGYAYGVLIASSQAVWTSLSAIVPASNVTMYVDSTNSLVFFRCPASVWNSSYNVTIGSFSPVSGGGGPPPTVYTQVWYFGI